MRSEWLRRRRTRTLLPWLRGIINNPNEEVDLRSRAIRVLAEEIGDTRTLHQVYPQLQASELREQVVRSIGEHGTRDDIALLRTIFLDANEQGDVRERAVRVLGELGFTSELQAAFDRVDSQDLQERIVRVVSEHGTRADLDWTEQIARNPKVGADVRERAVKTKSSQSPGCPARRSAGFYDQVNDADLQDRLLRLLGERGDAAAIAKLNQVAREEWQSGPARARRPHARKVAGSQVEEGPGWGEESATVAVKAMFQLSSVRRKIGHQNGRQFGRTWTAFRSGLFCRQQGAGGVLPQ